jgi:hypothetical protein
MARQASHTTRGFDAEAEKRGSPAEAGLPNRADERIRTADPFITSEVLYQLSYVGAGSKIP